ncbi:hypothetical protein AC1031_015611 [Aphanomyces cochlioides]|nr:hypothetical protein AC1031_015611 [Aphanomyces cochlioides]
MWGAKLRQQFSRNVLSTDHVSAFSVANTERETTSSPLWSLSSPRMRPRQLIQMWTIDTMNAIKSLQQRISWQAIRHHKCFDPHATKLAIWNSVLLLFVLYDVLAVSSILAFGHHICEHPGPLQTLIHVAETAFLGDVYVSCYTGFYHNGDLVREPAMTRMKYIKSRQFPLDVAALIPLSFIPVDPTFCGLLFLNKLLRLQRVQRYIASFDKVFARYYILSKLVKVVVALYLFCHVMSCLYLAFGYAHHSDDGGHQWRLPEELAHAPVSTKQSAALAWVMGIVSKCLEGGTPRTLLETIFMLIVMLGGFLLFAYICGTLFMISKCEANNREHFDAKLNQLRYVLSFHRVPSYIQSRAVDFLEEGFKSRASQDRSNMSLLCPSIVKDIKFTLLRRMVAGVPFFRGCNSSFLRAVIDLMETQSHPTNYFVCREGDHGEDMFFVQSGVLTVLVDSVKVRELRKGDFFGELSLFMNQVRTADVTTATFCILHRLGRVHITRVLNAYPDVEAIILERVAKTTEKMANPPKDPTEETQRRASLLYLDVPNRVGSRSLYFKEDIQGAKTQVIDDGEQQGLATLANNTLSASMQSSWWSKLLLHKALDRKARYRFKWLLAVMLVTLYNLVVAPFLCAFELIGYPTAIVLLNTVADLILWADIYGKFNLSYVKEAEQIIDTRKCAMHYFCSGFTFDFICVFPWWWFYPSASASLRLIRLLRLCQYHIELEEVAMFTHLTSRRRMILLGLYLFLSYHIAGCMAQAYTYVAGYGHDEFGWLPPESLHLTPVVNDSVLVGYLRTDGSMIPPDSHEISATLFRLYARAFQYGAVCITNLGLPFEPNTVGEYLLAFGLYLFGVLLVSYIIDEMQKRVTASAVEQMEFLTTRSRILHFLKKQKAPANLHRRVLSFLDFSWSAHRGADLNELVSELPNTIQRDIYGHICGTVLDKLAHMDHIAGVLDRLKNMLLDNITIQLYGQSEMIYHVGDEGDLLYVLLQGNVSTYTSARDTSHLHNMLPGDIFGVSTLQFDVDVCAHKENAIARSSCVVATISRETIVNIHLIYSKFSENLLKTTKHVRHDAHGTLLKLVESKSGTAVNPDSTASVLWETFLFFGITYQSISVPFYMAFGFSKSGIAAADGFSIFLEICFLIDIYLKTRTGFYLFGNKVMDIQAIRKRYLYSWNFFIDVLAIIPTNLINAFTSSPRSEAWNINKLLRLFKLSSQLAHLERQYFTMMTQLRIFKLVFYIYLLSHFIGCTWYNFASNESVLLGVIKTQQFGENEWLPGLDIALSNRNVSNVLKFTKAFYWGLGMLLGFLPGRHPTTELECFFTVVVQTFGVFLLAYVVGHLLDIVNVMDGSSRQFYSNLNYVRKLLDYFVFSEGVMTKIQYFYFYRLFHSIHEEHILVKSLPPPLATDIRMFLLKPMLRSVPFLQEEFASDHITRVLVSRMTQQLVSRGEIIFRQGDAGQDMFFVFSGSLSVYVMPQGGRSDNPIGVKVNEISDGSYFGERSLFSSKPRTATIQAKTFCTLYTLSLSHMQSVFKWHPEWKEKVMEIIQRHFHEHAVRMQAVTSTPTPLLKKLTTTKIMPLEGSENGSKLHSTTSSSGRNSVSFTKRNLVKSGTMNAILEKIRITAMPWWRRYAHNFVYVEVQSPVYRIYLGALCASLLYVALSVPYMLTFGNHGLGQAGFYLLLVVNIITDSVFVYDAWLKRNLIVTTKAREFYDKDDALQRSSVIVDIFAVLPLDYLLGAFFNWSALLRFNRLLKLRQLNHTIHEVYRFSMSYEVNRLKLLVLYYFILSFWTACMYFGLTFVDGFDVYWNSSLPTKEFMLDNDTFELAVHRLLRCMYFSATMYTGAGIVYEPDTMIQYIFILLVSVFGVFLMGYVIGEGSTLCIYLIQNEVDFQIHQMNIMEYLVEKRLSASLHGRIHAYMSFWWNAHQGVAFHSIIEQLPPKIRSQASLQIARLSISRFTMRFLRPLAKDAPDHEIIVQSIAERVIFEGYPKGESVIVQGNIGQTMYFVSKGELISRSTMPGVSISRYTEGQYFGEEGFLGASMCPCSVMATRACDLLSISADNFIAALQGQARFAEALAIARDVVENVAYPEMCLNDSSEELVRITIEERASSLVHFTPMPAEKCLSLFGPFLKLLMSSHAIKKFEQSKAPSPVNRRRSMITCEKCLKRLACVLCSECQANYCSPCSIEVHSSDDLRSHLDRVRSAELYKLDTSLLGESFAETKTSVHREPTRELAFR